MTPTEKHRETAREAAVLAVDQCGGCGCDDCLGNVERIIAAALAKSKREGMKTAAEIARNRYQVWIDGDGILDGEGFPAVTCDVSACENISLAILSEAGED